MKARFELNKKIVKEQYEKAVECADEISYSFKTNYEVGKVLEEISKCSFSLHSLKALEKLKDKSRAWYFAQAWNEEEIKKALNMGAKSFVVDNEQDLNCLLNFLKSKDIKINLLLRMRLKEHTVNTGKHFVFGFFTNQINELIPKLSDNKNINDLGIHMHRKTQNVSEWSLHEELEQSLEKDILKKIKIANIGGGLPGVYKNFRAETLKVIIEKIKQTRKWFNSKGIKVIMEPGRFIAAPAVKLVTEIKAIYNNNIVLNCSVYNSAMDTFVANIRLLVDGELESGEAYTLKGISPDSLDIFRYRVYLKNPKVGDKIIFLNAGAYNFTTDFCLLPKLETVIV